MRHEHDEIRDIVRTIHSDAPVADTRETTINGMRYVFAFDADGNLVYIEIHGYSVLKEQQQETVRRTIQADRSHTEPLGTFKWRIIDGESGNQIAEGTKHAVLGEVSIEIVESPESNLALKKIPIADTYNLCLATSCSSDPEVIGFALTGERSDMQCFSWDWFNVDGPGHATKLQEPGELRFAVGNPGGLWEIVETEFLTDISVRIARFGVEDPVHNVAWRIEIEKGSLIRWPSVVNGLISL